MASEVTWQSNPPEKLLKERFHIAIQQRYYDTNTTPVLQPYSTIIEYHNGVDMNTVVCRGTTLLAE
jgi:hypothetical protein